MPLFFVKASVIVQADDHEGAESIIASIFDGDDSVLEFRIEDPEAVGYLIDRARAALIDRARATTTKGAT